MSINHYPDDFYDDTMIHNQITVIGPKNTHYPKNHHTFLYPYNLTVFQINPTLDNVLINTGPEMDKQESRFFN